MQAEQLLEFGIQDETYSGSFTVRYEDLTEVYGPDGRAAFADDDPGTQRLANPKQ
jgi:hypothetical protein